MNDLIKIPIWFFEIFTTAKSFRDNPLIGSPLLNKLGLHVVRVVFSHLVMRVRMLTLSIPITRKDRQNYFKQGFILKENFLSDADFDALQKEVSSFKAETRENIQGDTLTHRAELSPDVLKDYPLTGRLISDPELGRLARFTAGHFRKPLYYLENVKNKYSSGSNDPQKHFHVDTFHPSMKCWFFMHDVGDEMGPYMYIPGSHKLTWKRLKWQYRKSLIAKDAKNGLHAKGSFRFSQEDTEELGFSPPKAFAVKKNTLLIANVFGVHRRGNSENKSTRLAIWGDSRTNPFIPFPGIGGKLANEIQYYFLGLYRKNADKEALKRGSKIPWRIIKQDEKA